MVFTFLYNEMIIVDSEWDENAFASSSSSHSIAIACLFYFRTRPNVHHFQRSVVREVKLISFPWKRHFCRGLVCKQFPSEGISSKEAHQLRIWPANETICIRKWRQRLLSILNYRKEESECYGDNCSSCYVLVVTFISIVSLCECGCPFREIKCSSIRRL